MPRATRRLLQQLRSGSPARPVASTYTHTARQTAAIIVTNKFLCQLADVRPRIIMADITVEEIESLQREFDWVLNTEVQSVIQQLRAAVQVQDS